MLFDILNMGMLVPSVFILFRYLPVYFVCVIQSISKRKFICEERFFVWSNSSSSSEGSESLTELSS